MQPKVVLDCDPGDDDALALAVLATHAELIGVTTVAGNAALEDVTRNALWTVEALGLDVPVHAGARGPLLGGRAATHSAVHGPRGFGSLVRPGPHRKPASVAAADYLVDTVRNVEGVVVVATGPLTNLAQAFQAAPEIVGRLRQLVVMGGSSGPGNRAAVAEANVLSDPEAAEVVLSAGCPTRLVGLDVTRQVSFGRDDLDQLRALGRPVADFYAELLAHTLAAYRDRVDGRFERPLHDPCAALAAVRPDLFRFERLDVQVELTGTHTRGMTVIDRRDRFDRRRGGIEVAVEVDAAAVCEAVLNAVAGA